MRKMTVLGTTGLLIAGLVASPVAALAAPSSLAPTNQNVGGSHLAAYVTPLDEAEAVQHVEEDPEELAATGTSTAIGFTLIAVALIGGGVTLTMLRRKGALDG